MNLSDYIKHGEQQRSTGKALAEYLGIMPPDLSAAKNGRRGLPAFACVKLAQLIGEDERRVIAASELVTEKNPERRAVWLPFVQEIAARAPKRAMAATKATARKVAKCCPAALKQVDATSRNG